jgi:hypothetical protein
MGNNNEALISTWKLVSCFMEDVETKEQKPVWGEHPNGYIVLTAEGRWIVIQTAEGRKAPQTDEDRAAAFRSMSPIPENTERKEIRLLSMSILREMNLGMAQSKFGTSGLKVTGYTLKRYRSLTPILAAR